MVGVEHIIWLGDFNRHHPMWDEDHNAHLFMRTNLDGAQHLINVVIELNLKMALPKTCSLYVLWSQVTT